MGYLIQAIDHAGRDLGLRRVEEGYAGERAETAEECMTILRTRKTGARLGDDGTHTTRCLIVGFIVTDLRGGRPETYTRDWRTGVVTRDLTGRAIN